MENLYTLVIPKDHLIKVDKSNMGNEKAHSKIIKIALQTHNLGEGINSLNELNISDLAWSTSSNEVVERDKSLQIIFENKNLDPWKLIKKTR